VFHSLGEKEKAADHFNRSLALTRALGNRQNESNWFALMIQFYCGRGEMQKALDYYQEMLSLLQAIKDRRSEARMRYEMAAIERDQGHLIEARTNIEAALQITESLRADVVNAELRASYFASVQKYYELSI